MPRSARSDRLREETEKMRRMDFKHHHDRNASPLTAGYAEIIQNGDAGRGIHRRYAAVIPKNAAYTWKRLIDDPEADVPIENGSFPRQPGKRQNMVRFLKRVGNRYLNTPEYKTASSVLTARGRHFSIRLIQKLLTRAFRNLIINAWYTEENL